MKTKRYVTLIGMTASFMLLGACAYQRPAEVTAQMARTEATLKQAEQSGAQVNALPELQVAKDKYADAQKALSKNNEKSDKVAVQLAQQAQADAQHAAAKAQATRQKQAATEIQDGVDALRDETVHGAEAAAERSTNQ